MRTRSIDARPALALLLGVVAACKPSAPSPVAARASHDDRTNHELPFGLKWGQSPGEVKQALLAGGLSLQEERQLGPGHVKQAYQGVLLGVPANPVTTDFRENGLIALILVIPDNDARPATQRWQEMVDIMTRTGGEPSQATRLPQDDSGYALEDQKLKAGAACPHAAWFFKGTAVTISINSSKLDGNGVRTLRPTWGFFGPGAFKR